MDECSLEDIRRMLPQSGMFVSALVAYQLGEEWNALPDSAKLNKIIGRAVFKTYISGQTSHASWPTLLKSQNFFEQVRKNLKPGLVASKSQEKGNTSKR